MDLDVFVDYEANRLNDFKVSDSDCSHHDENCVASVVVV